MAARYDLTTDGTNGAVISTTMSSEWSALQFIARCTDVSGNLVSVPAKSLVFAVSPDASGTVWTNIESNRYSGLAVRLRVTKTGLPVSVTNVTVTIYRAMDTNGLPSGVFSGTRAITTQGYVEANIKNGVQFNASRRQTALAGSANSDSVMTTGAKTVILKSRVIGYTGAGISMSLFRAPTFTGGTAGVISNNNDVSPVTSTVSLLSQVTTTVTGTQVGSVLYAEGNTSNTGEGAPFLSIGEEFILRPNTVYLLRVTSLDTQAQNITPYISWYEGETDLPLA